MCDESNCHKQKPPWLLNSTKVKPNGDDFLVEINVDRQVRNDCFVSQLECLFGGDNFNEYI